MKLRTARGLAALGLLLAAFAAGCSGIATNYDYDTSADFAALATYGLMPTPTFAPEVSELDVKRVEHAVAAELEAKGYRPSDSPDFRVAIHLGSESKVRVVDRGYGYAAGGVWWHGGNVDVYQYEEGMLVLDVVDAATSSVIWRGTARKALSSEPTPEKRAEIIGEAVKKVLADFPPPG